MGNMLESDSSINSDESGRNDDQIIKKEIRERTAGDGMESDLIKGAIRASSSTDLSARNRYSQQHNEMLTPVLNPCINEDHATLSEMRKDIYPILNIKKDAKSNSESHNVHANQSIQQHQLSHVNTESFQQNQNRNIVHATISPRQLPSKDLLIPIKPQKLEQNSTKSANISSTSYDKFTAVGVTAAKQKAPKFIPYEPYTCAVRQMTGTKKKSHSRKPSESSSVLSESSVLSSAANNSIFSINQNQEVPFTEMGIDPQQQNVGAMIVINPHLQNQLRESTSSENPSGVVWENNQPFHNSTLQNNQTQNNSHALMKERLKISEKEVSELLSENARLKKLLVNAMTGGNTVAASARSPSAMVHNQNIMNNNAHALNESFDNLNDELEVWRSKFLSSCVLVEQLSKDNHRMTEIVTCAADIIKDLKSTTSSLTQKQYDNINEWFRKANALPTPYAVSQLVYPNSNYNTNEYLQLEEHEQGS